MHVVRLSFYQSSTHRAERSQVQVAPEENDNNMKTKRSDSIPVKNFFIQYHPVEDRLHVSILCSDDSAQKNFWLTNRLCNNMIQAQIDWLEKAQHSHPVIDKSIVLSCQHQQAQWQQKLIRKKKKQKTNEIELLKKIIIRNTRATSSIIFPLSDDLEARLAMKPHKLHQFLALLFQQYAKAGWGLDIWPSWMAETASKNN